jgi:Ca2+-binding EF-hand superfamily protein
MTLSDFVNALLPYDYSPGSERSDVIDSDNVPEFFKTADIDGDGLISFDEYMFFIVLLGIPHRYFQVAFRMFDKDSSGSIDFDEFKGVIEVVRAQSPIFSLARNPRASQVNDNLWFTLFFGKDKPKASSISYQRFAQVIASLQKGVRELEFYRLDPQRTGKISLRSFAMTLIGFASHKDVPAYAARADSLASRSETVSLKEFFDFALVIEHVCATNPNTS